MTLEAKTRRDLEAGPSTSSALSQRLHVTKNAVEIVLTRLLSENEIRSYTICDGSLTVYSLKPHTPPPTTTTP
jgi:hypothetical protein